MVPPIEGLSDRTGGVVPAGEPFLSPVGAVMSREIEEFERSMREARQRAGDGGRKPGSDMGDTIAGDTIFGNIVSPADSRPGTDVARGTSGSRISAAMQSARKELQLLSALVCEELRVDKGAATAFRIADTFQVPDLPLSLTVGLMLRFRALPGSHELSLRLDTDGRVLYECSFEVPVEAGPCRTVLVPSLDLTLTRVGEQRIQIHNRQGIVGELPIFVKFPKA